MRKNLIKKIFLFFTLLVSFQPFAQNKKYAEKDGLVVIDLENSKNNWVTKDTIPNFTGTGYIQWEGSESFSKATNGVIEIPVKINKPGTYEVRMRVAIADLSLGTKEHNDTWLKVTGNQYFATKGIDTVRPKPVCTQMLKKCAAGSSTDGFFKMFGGGKNWQWQNKTSDFDDHFVHVVFDTVGTYKVILAARSKFHAVDRIVMYDISSKTRADAEKLTNLETIEETVPVVPCTDVLLEAITKFGTLQIPGFSPAYVDNTNKCLAINAVQHKDKFAAASTIFEGESTKYNITLNTLTELDGESEYYVYLNSKKIGYFKNPETTVDYAPAKTSFLNVDVKKGDTIRVEFSSHTNLKIVEGTGTAYSRGRWKSLEFKCVQSSGSVNIPPTIQLISPIQGASYYVSDGVRINADAKDTDGFVKSVKIYANNLFVKELNTSPFFFDISGLPLGENTVYAIATDNKDSIATSSKITFTLKKDTILPVSAAATLVGELKKWHNIKLVFDGPTTSEDAPVSPFLNYRMDVTFVHQSGSPTIKVPGYFAADGNAKNTSAKAGNKWVVHFRPSKIGKWNYTASLQKGTNLAIYPDSIGIKVGSFDGQKGEILVQENDKTGNDLRAKGKLLKSTKNFLQFAESKAYFMKFGPDSPENLLNYIDFDFDDVLDNCATKCYQHLWSGHADDYKTGNPTWQTNKGKNLIGAINYLADSAKVNSFSMSLQGGDDLNVFPWTKKNEYAKFDISKLDQWETVFEHAEQKGLVLHLKLAEAENFKKLNNIFLKLFYREMVARFGHHLGLELNISEEFAGVQGTGFGTYKDAAIVAIERANYLKKIDGYKTPIALHTGPNTGKLIYDEIINLDPNAIDIASLQDAEANNWDASYLDAKNISRKVKQKNANWAIYSDEQNPGSKGVFYSSVLNSNHVDSVSNFTRNVLWGNLIGGGAGTMWYGGSVGDFQTENYRRYKSLHHWSKTAVVDIFQKLQLPFWEMSPKDSLATPVSKHQALAYKDSLYVVYTKDAKDLNIQFNLDSTVSYSLRWFSPTDARKSFYEDTIFAGENIKISSPNLENPKDLILILTKIIPPVITGNESVKLNKLDIKVFPNPSIKGFNVETKEKGMVYVFNSNGLIVEK
ncbi:MAG: DUF5060 domain-containing protein, partial [Pseudarcicella sp.]|nr:DUF5060 domain-containing protein [Pseudarcicella sp.]